MIVIGIDPGQTGAVAAIMRDGSFVSVTDLPFISHEKKLSWVDGSVMLSLLMGICMGRPARVYVERAQAMPSQGASSGFNYGVGFGAVLATIQVAGLPLEFISPAKWKAAMKLGDRKSGALDKARLLFPDAELARVKDHGRAEALLIAHYALHHLVPA